MKKIGILNYHRAVNYGAVLQCLALQKSIESLGAEAEVLDYKNDLIENQYKIRKFKDQFNIKYKLLYLLVYKNANIRREKFIEFRRKYLNLTKELDSQTIKTITDEYDEFIVGSDQVWNLNQSGNDFNYFLDFVDNNQKKNSYAASFGVDTLTSEQDKIKEKINQFDKISLREEQGKTILKTIGVTAQKSESAKTVLDPTFLLSKTEWENLLHEYKPAYVPKEKYIFVYAFSGHKNIKKQALHLSEKYNLKVIWLTYGKTLPSNIYYLKTADPLDFLYYVANAEYVITNSFHGTAFSIIFNKNFSLEFLQGGYNVNSRLENILKVFELEDVQINSDTDTTMNKIDYAKVNDLLDNLKIDSITYLESIIR